MKSLNTQTKGWLALWIILGYVYILLEAYPFLLLMGFFMILTLLIAIHAEIKALSEEKKKCLDKT